MLNGDFAGRDLLVTWERNPANEANGFVLKDYIVEIIVDSELLRTEFVTDTKYTYYFSDMVLDQETGNPSREVTVRLYERITSLEVSDPEIATFENPRPATPTFSLTAGYKVVQIDIDPIVDNDLVGYNVFRGTTSGFTADETTLIYRGPSPVYVDNGVSIGTTYYYKVSAYDGFAETLTAGNISSSIAADPLSVEGLEGFQAIIEFPDLVFGVSENTLSWSAGTAYKRLADSVTTQAIAAGNVTYTDTKLFIYYDWNLGLIRTTTNILEALMKTDNRIVATYDGGTNLHIGTTKPIIDGNSIIAGSITGSQLVTNDAIITGTAQIADAVIENVNIKDGEITVSKLDTDDFAVEGLALFGGDLQSNNYVTEVSGWKIDQTGDAEFNNLITRGWVDQDAISDVVFDSLVSTDLTVGNPAFGTYVIGLTVPNTTDMYFFGMVTKVYFDKIYEQWPTNNIDSLWTARLHITGTRTFTFNNGGESDPDYSGDEVIVFSRTIDLSEFRPHGPPGPMVDLSLPPFLIQYTDVQSIPSSANIVSVNYEFRAQTEPVRVPDYDEVDQIYVVEGEIYTSYEAGELIYPTANFYDGHTYARIIRR